MSRLDVKALLTLTDRLDREAIEELTISLIKKHPSFKISQTLSETLWDVFTIYYKKICTIYAKDEEELYEVLANDGEARNYVTRMDDHIYPIYNTPEESECLLCDKKVTLPKFSDRYNQINEELDHWVWSERNTNSDMKVREDYFKFCREESQNRESLRLRCHARGVDPSEIDIEVWRRIVRKEFIVDHSIIYNKFSYRVKKVVDESD